MKTTNNNPQNEPLTINGFAAQYDIHYSIGNRKENIGLNQRVADRRAQRKAELAAIFGKYGCKYTCK